MPINFYLHTPLPDSSNERRAILQIARLLYKQCADSKQTYTLIANINPDQDINLNQLPQLDALLLAPKFAAILEIKAYFDPIIGQNLTGKWFATNRIRKQQVRGGSKRNPYLQVKNAKTAWQSLLNIPLHAFLLFYPYLHPNSRLPKLHAQHAWLAIQSIEQISALLFNTRTNNFSLDVARQMEIAESVLLSQRWAVEPLLKTIAGYLYLFEKDQPLIRYPVHSFDTVTIGRSKRVNHAIQLNSKQISSSHAQIFMVGDDLFIEDLDSKNGIYHKGKRLTMQFRLPSNEPIYLGGKEADAPQIWFSPQNESASANPTLPTI
ncbi:MAG: hypothetical protein DHS20C20_03920 [Ardenticatenaceae bacterium]|nr:MAG: hypothetical protein DHS20C20_03920 [Ardenticatenaceae bacterium]